MCNFFHVCPKNYPYVVNDVVSSEWWRIHICWYCSINRKQRQAHIAHTHITARIVHLLKLIEHIDIQWTNLFGFIMEILSTRHSNIIYYYACMDIWINVFYHNTTVLVVSVNQINHWIYVCVRLCVHYLYLYNLLSLSLSRSLFQLIELTKCLFNTETNIYFWCPGEGCWNDPKQLGTLCTWYCVNWRR